MKSKSKILLHIKSEDKNATLTIKTKEPEVLETIDPKILKSMQDRITEVTDKDKLEDSVTKENKLDSENNL